MATRQLVYSLTAATLLAPLPAVVVADEDGGPTLERRAELVHLLKHDCGACHGMQLEGGLGPSLSAAELNAKPVEFLVDTVLSGRPGTPMAGWRGLLSEAEARWLVQYLKQDRQQ